MTKSLLQRIARDPRFAKLKREKTKVEIDDRFKRVLEEDAFTGDCSTLIIRNLPTPQSVMKLVTVDKRGRKVKSKGEDLKRLYRLEESKKDEAEDVEETLKSEEELSESEEVLQSEEEEEVLQEDTIGGVNMREEILDTQEIPMGEETRRLAAVNLDWDRLTAEDLFSLFHSMTFGVGTLQRIEIYTSEFGKEKLKEEERRGPPASIYGQKGMIENLENLANEEDARSEASLSETAEALPLNEEEQTHFDLLRLRQYQLERLRYYYAVLTFDEVATARHVYTQFDGSEIEKTSNFLDLRFIPDEESFTDEPHSQCHTLPDRHKALDYTTKALQQTNPTLTWEEEDTRRFNVLRKDFSHKELDDLDFKDYIASNSSEEEEETPSREEAYRDILSKQEEAPQGDMEITFSAEAQPIKEKKRKASRVKQIDEPSIAEAADQSDPEQGHFDLKQILKYQKLQDKKRKSRKDKRKLQQLKEEGDLEDAGLDMNDNRFQSVLKDPAFAIDPNLSSYKPTKAMQGLLHQSKSKKAEDEDQ